MSSTTAGRATIADSVHKTIQGWIIEHRVGPGERLTIDAVAQELGVSQTPVREAMNRLASGGLAVYIPQSGYRVEPPLDRVGFNALMEARATIEVQTAALAALRRTSPAIAALEALICEVEEATDIYQRLDADARFHREIAHVAANSFLVEALDNLRVHVHIFRIHVPENADAVTTDEHRELVDAIRDGDPTSARHAMRRHITASCLRHAAGFTDDHLEGPSALSAAALLAASEPEVLA